MQLTDWGFTIIMIVLPVILIELTIAFSAVVFIALRDYIKDRL